LFLGLDQRVGSRTRKTVSSLELANITVSIAVQAPIVAIVIETSAAGNLILTRAKDSHDLVTRTLANAVVRQKLRNKSVVRTRGTKADEISTGCAVLRTRDTIVASIVVRTIGALHS
jgi:hypothetical protein